MGIVSEFKEFISRGNVIDLAVGVVIGGAFGDITKSLVDKVIMPPIGLLLSGVDFSDMKLVLKAANPAAKTAEVAIQYGAFANTVIQFLIIAFVIFILVKGVNAIRRKDAEVPVELPPPTADQVLLGEIRDLLKAR